jgi:poly(3-hydroxybutyrate) depolymerase
MAILVCALSFGCKDDPSEIVGPEDPGFTPPDLKEVFWGPEVPKTPGRHDLTVKFNGENRPVIVYVPATYQAGSAAPLVLALPGAHHNAATMENDHPNLIAAAREKGVVLAFPGGQGRPKWRG